ncbi:MAG: hypothetical protein ABS879_08010 [Eubacteriales bacterium]
MKSAWMVSSQYVNGTKLYSCYRIRDVNETDHSGNREYCPGFFDEREDAVEYAAMLNDKEERK